MNIHRILSLFLGLLAILSIIGLAYVSAQVEIDESPEELSGVVITSPSEISGVGVTGNLTNFTSLEDTPGAYVGDGGDCVVVNVGETGLEFIACPSGGGGSNLSDVVFFNETGGAGKNITLGDGGWFFGLFDIVVNSIYGAFNGSDLTLDDDLLNTNLNQTDLILTVNQTDNIAALGVVINDTDGWTVNFTRLQSDAYQTDQGTFIFNIYDDGSEGFLNASSVMDAFGLEVENSKLILYNEPTAGNDFKVFQVFSREAQDITEFVVTKAGDGHTSYFIRSLAIVGNEDSIATPFNCTTYAKYIDCRTGVTGADLYVVDDAEINGTIYVGEGINATDWNNISMVLNQLSDVDTTGVDALDFLQFDGANWLDFDLLNSANIFSRQQSFTNLGTSIKVAEKIEHDGDSNTFISFSTPDLIRLEAGGNRYVTMVISFLVPGFTVNPLGGNIDFFVNGLTIDGLISTDASADTINFAGDVNMDKNLTVINLNVSGEAQGQIVSLMYNDPVLRTGSANVRWGQSSATGVNGDGIIMPRDGSIISHTTTVDLTGASVSGDVSFRLEINNTNVAVLENEFLFGLGTSRFVKVNNIPRNTAGATFSAGDNINALSVETGDMTWDDSFGFILVQFDMWVGMLI